MHTLKTTRPLAVSVFVRCAEETDPINLTPTQGHPEGARDTKPRFAAWEYVSVYVAVIRNMTSTALAVGHGVSLNLRGYCDMFGTLRGYCQ